MPQLSNRPPQMVRYSGDKARVSIGGKYTYLGKWGSDQARSKYNTLIAKWRKDQDVAKLAIEDRTLIAELTADYIDFAKDYFGPGHNRATSIIPVIKRFGLHFGDLWTDEFLPHHLEQAREIWMLRKCSRSYINRCMQVIVRCFKWGVTKKKVPAAVWQALEAVESLDPGRHGVREADPVKPVPLSVVDETLPELPVVVADMVRVQLYSGCRPNEIMRLTPAAIDRSGDVWKYKPILHKNAWRKKVRTVYLGPQAQGVLAKYMLRAPDEPCFATKAGKAFARGGYRQVIRRTINDINDRRRKEADDPSQVELLPHWTPNQLRHLKATELRAMRNLEAARLILGHSSHVVTEIYAEANEEPALEIARKLG